MSCFKCDWLGIMGLCPHWYPTGWRQRWRSVRGAVLMRIDDDHGAPWLNRSASSSRRKRSLSAGEMSPLYPPE